MKLNFLIVQNFFSLEIFLFIDVSFSNLLTAVTAKGYKSSLLLSISLYAA